MSLSGGSFSRTSSSKDRMPRSTSCITATAVTSFVSEAPQYNAFICRGFAPSGSMLVRPEAFWNIVFPFNG